MENPGASKYHGLPARPLLRPSGHPSEQALEYHAILAAFKTVSSRKQGYGTKEYAEAADLPNFPQSRRFCRITSEQVSLRSAKGSFLRLHSGINAAKKQRKKRKVTALMRMVRSQKVQSQRVQKVQSRKVMAQMAITRR
jgi:hypothetical protein